MTPFQSVNLAWGLLVLFLNHAHYERMWKFALHPPLWQQRRMKWIAKLWDKQESPFMQPLTRISDRLAFQAGLWLVYLFLAYKQENQRTVEMIDDLSYAAYLVFSSVKWHRTTRAWIRVVAEETRKEFERE